jgi:hypothetical protein
VLKPVDQIVVDHPDEAEMNTGNPQNSEANRWLSRCAHLIL